LALTVIHFTLLSKTLKRDLDFVFNDAQHRVGPGTDFGAYYVSAVRWRQGKGIYGHGPGFGYRYHPAFVLTAGNLLSRLDLKTAHKVWVGINEAFLVLALILARRLFPVATHFLAAAAILVFFSPYYLEQYMGNCTFAAAALLFLAFELYRSDRLVLFLGAFVASVLIKPLGLVFLPLLLLRKEFVLVGAIAVVVVATALPYFLLDPAGWNIFYKINTAPVPWKGWVIHGGNQGLNGLLVDLCTRLSGVPTKQLESLRQLPSACRFLLYAYPILLFALTVACMVRLRESLSVGIFLCVAIYLLCYKDVWEHSYVILLPGLAYLWHSGVVNRTLILCCSIGLALPTAFALYDPPLPPGPIDPEHVWGLGTSLVHHTTKPIWVVALFLGCLHAALLTRGSGTPANMASD